MGLAIFFDDFLSLLNLPAAPVKELYEFPFMIGVMFLYMTYIKKFENEITHIECPYCEKSYFNEFPRFLRKTKCYSCEREINFYG